MVGFSGVGSLPGTDFPAAVRLVFDEIAAVDHGLPFLPELPARGPWADLIGRGCGVLVDLPVSLATGGWQLSDTMGIDGRRARHTLRDDLDMLQEQAHDYTGELKVQVCGPWTLAASLFRPLGGRVLADRSARRDVAQSLAQGTSDLLAQLTARLPGARPLLQVDEPSLPAVLAGRVPTEGGYFRHRAVDVPEAAEALRGLAELSEGSVLHCCDRLPVGFAASAGFAGFSVDPDLTSDWDAVAAAVERGETLFFGCLPSAAEVTPQVDAIVTSSLRALRPLELGDRLAERLVLVPSCGLAGWSPSGAAAALRALGRAVPLVDEALRS